MKVLRTVSLLLVFVSVAGAFIYLKYNDEQKRRQIEELNSSQVLFTETLSNEVNYLAFEEPGKPVIRLKKNKEEWMITDPVSTPADQMIARGIVSALRFGRKEETFDSSEQSEAYGFDRPSVKLTVGTSRNFRNAYLILGDKVPLKKLYYAKWEGSDQVFLISEKLWKAFDRSLLSLRRRLVFDIDLSDLKGFRICTFGRYFDVIRKGDSWVFADTSEHVGEKIDSFEVKAYIELLRSIVVGEFLDNKNWKEDQWGIRLKQNYISVYFNKAKPQILNLGYPSRELNGTFIHMDKIFNLGLIHSKIARRIQRSPESFYDHRVWRDADTEVKKIEIRRDGESTMYYRAPSGWLVNKMNPLRESKKVWLDNMLSVIQELKYQDLIPSKETEYDKTRTSFEIRIFTDQIDEQIPYLDLKLFKQADSKSLEGIAKCQGNVPVLNGAKDDSLFKLNINDSEILQDLVQNLTQIK